MKNESGFSISGIVLMITNVLTVVAIVYTMLIIVPAVGNVLIHHDIAAVIPEENIEFSIVIDEEVMLDDRVIYFDELIYEKDGTMNIVQKNYDKYFRLGGWTLGHIGEIIDSFGNTYNGSVGFSRGGHVSYGITTIENFPSDATSLTIDYNRYNRQYRIDIPIKVGVENE